MDPALQTQINKYLSHLNGLISRGRQLRELLAANPTDAFANTAMRVWQQDVGIAINELSGGSKAHWLARAFSEAFLLRSEKGHALEGAAPDEIVRRLLDVVEQAVVSLSRREDVSLSSESAATPPPRRFEFVHNAELRPVVEQAFRDSQEAFSREDYNDALRTSCGILEAIVTDALELKGLDALAALGAPEGKLSDWPFETRLAVAEKAGLIRRGWARLPAAALAYRDDKIISVAVSERDARQSMQVLRVVMRDLDPGR
jgi:hypothetical protein